MSLKIYDGRYPDLFVDLDDGVTAAIARTGWRQAGPNPLPGGMWGDVEETVRVTLLTGDNSVYSRLMALNRRAQDVQSPTHPDHLNPAHRVAAEAKTPNEVIPRWALVSSIRVEKLDPRHYLANGQRVLEVKFTREGLWRGVRPGGTYPLYSADSWDRAAYIDIDNDTAPLYGDAPPLVIWDIATAAPFTYSKSFLTAESFTTGQEPGFSPWLQAAEPSFSEPPFAGLFISSLPSPFNADWLPGGWCIELVYGPSTIGWDFSSTHPGTYSVYALVVNNQATNDITLQAEWKWETLAAEPIGDTITGLPASLEHWNLVKLGTFRLPPAGAIGRGIALGGRLQVSAFQPNPHPDRAYLGGLILLPHFDVAGQTITMRGVAGGTRHAIIDGEIERYHELSTLLPFEDTIRAQFTIPDGPYQTLTPGPGLSNRIYILPTAGQDGEGILSPMDQDWQLTINYVPRWQYLNQEMAQ